jgi:hypothetical protein
VAKKAKRESTTVELVVRRGALRRFHKLKEKAANLPVNVIWDRRQGDRRSASTQPNSERRKADRRQTPPFTWEVGDFVVVAPAQTPARRKKPSKKANASH